MFLKCRQINRKTPAMTFFFRQSCSLKVCNFTKNVLLYKYFQIITFLRFIVNLLRFLNILEKSISQNTFLLMSSNRFSQFWKYPPPQKLYIQGRWLSAEKNSKTLHVSSRNLIHRLRDSVPVLKMHDCY